MLESREIEKSFKKRKVLNKISFKIKSGEIIGLIGPNGAGKSTLLNILMGTIRQNKGDIIYKNKRINKSPVYKRARRGISYLTQEDCLINDLSVIDNIKIVLELLKYSQKEHKNILNQKIEEYGLEIVAKQKVKNLSSGERKRLSLMLTLLNGAELILLDEPFTKIDSHATEIIFKIINQFKKNNKTSLVIVDHSLNKVLKFADIILFLRGGDLEYSGSASDFMKTNIIKEYNQRIEGDLGDSIDNKSKKH